MIRSGDKVYIRTDSDEAEAPPLSGTLMIAVIRT